MTFSTLVRSLGRSRLTEELLAKLTQTHELNLNGLARLPKGWWLLRSLSFISNMTLKSMV